MLRKVIIYIGTALCMLELNGRVNLLERTYEIMKEAIPQLPQTY
jgi:hypothetical protein